MRLNTEPGVTFDDLNRYFAGCYVTDPNTNKPARIQVINSGGDVALQVASPSRWSALLVYTGVQAQPFYDLSTYAVPQLGWRRVGARVSYLYRRALSGGGVRGLNNERLASIPSNDVRTSEPVLSEPWLERSSVQLCYAVFNPPNLTFDEALTRYQEAEGRQAVPITPDFALLPPAMAAPGSSRYLVAFQRNVIGEGDSNTVRLANKQYLKYIGEINGPAVHCP